MPKEILQSKMPPPSEQLNPAFTDAQWSQFWEERGWIPPNRSTWPDPLQDRRFLLYAASLRDKFGFVRFVGLPTQGGPEDTPMETLFVEPVLSSERIDPSHPQKEWPRSFSLIDAVIDHPRLVVLGDPGSGKSTLVSWLVLSLLSREKNRLKDTVGSLIPVPLVLRDLEITGEVTWDKLLGGFMAHPTGQTLGSIETIESLLNSGQAMVLVDGLDEAGGAATRQRIVATLRAAFRRYPSVRWVITSRIVGYEETPLESFLLEGDTRRNLLTALQDDAYVQVFGGLGTLSHTVVQELVAEAEKRAPRIQEVASRLYVTPFDDARIAMFVRNWHEQHETNRAERSVRSAELIEAIDRSPQVKGLARIPNLLTMIALVYRVYLRLPDGRALLYERIAQAYLETIETARKLPTLGHTLEDMKRWLGYAAFQMQRARFAAQAANQKDHGILISRDDLIRHIVFAMAKGNAEAFEQQSPTAIAFVDWVTRRAGLVIPRTEDLFAFAHLSFQEYFAAWFIAEQITGPAWNKPGRKISPLATGTEVAILRQACVDVRWHETIVLLFELLAVRGEWSDELLELLFAPADDDEWTLKHNSEESNNRGTPLELLLITLARDQHSGLSSECRGLAFRRGWITLDMLGQHMRSMNTYRVTDLMTSLLEPMGGEISPALSMLVTPPKPLLLKVLPLGVSVSDAQIQALTHRCVSLETLEAIVIWGGRVTDVGALALAARDGGFNSLTSLHLHRTMVTDIGVRALARVETSLKALISLSLSNTKITDAGVRELARTETGLKSLNTLHLSETYVSDAGVRELARAETGLKALTALNLSETKVTDVGVKELARAETGIKELDALFLRHTKVTDAGVRELARADTGLKALTTLDLSSTQVTDAGVMELARADTGLRALSTLNLSSTHVTDVGVRELAREDTGLSAVTSLALGNTLVTDAGASVLACTEMGLKSLATLDLSGTMVTDAGVKELARAETGLRLLTVLDICNTRVTDAGIMELARAETGLKSLTSLRLYGTQVSDAGVLTLKARFPNITINHYSTPSPPT